MTGMLIEFSVKEWLYDDISGRMEHVKYSLVLYGAPKLAKTPFAKSMAAALSIMHHEPGTSDPIALVVNTVEALPRGGDPRIRRGTPILFDDLRPGVPRGNRPAHSLEDMKVLGQLGVLL